MLLPCDQSYTKAALPSPRTEAASSEQGSCLLAAVAVANRLFISKGKATYMIVYKEDYSKLWVGKGLCRYPPRKAMNGRGTEGPEKFSSSVRHFILACSILHSF